jgi:hypothetical protein
MDSLLKRIQRVRPSAFRSWDCLSLHNSAPAHKAAFANFWPKKCYNPLSPPILSRFISARLFSVPQVENEVKRTQFADVAELQVAVTDELKKVQKEEFSAALQKLYDSAKTCMYANGAYFEFKKVTCIPHVSSIFKKKSVLKRLYHPV